MVAGETEGEARDPVFVPMIQRRERLLIAAVDSVDQFQVRGIVGSGRHSVQLQHRLTFLRISSTSKPVG